MSDRILEDACAVDKRIYLLFPASLRINVLSQQVRALELVDALRRKDWMAGLTSIAVIGGGASGLTAAAALKCAGLRDGLSVTVFESRDQLMPLQSGCHDKLLAPRIIDWPSANSESATASVPLLTWRKGVAGNVAIDMIAQFERFNVEQLVGRTVIDVKEQGGGVIVHFMHEGKPGSRRFDLAIVAAGFGLEAEPVGIANETQSYWRVNPEQAPALKGDAPKSILISGLGDGGLTDFVLFACPGINQTKLCESIMSSPDVVPQMDEIQRIETEIWADPPTVTNIAEAYANLNLDVAARAIILPRLVRNTEFVLLTRQSQLFHRSTAPLNRLAASLVIRAMDLGDQNTRVCSYVGAEHLPDEGDLSVWSNEGKEEKRRFDAVITRHGDTSKETWKFNNSAIDAKVAELRTKRGAISMRPQVPVLSDRISDSFEARMLGSQPTRIRLTRLEDQIVWHGDLPIDDVGRIWKVPSAPIQIEIGFEPIGNDAGLDLAVCRLLAHAEPPAELAGPHAARWAELTSSVREKAGDKVRSAVTRSGTVVIDRNEFVAEADQLAGRLEAAMDRGLLGLLNHRVRRFAGSPADCPVGLHPEVITKVLNAWEEWFVEASALSSTNLRWVLCLFGGLLNGHGRPDPWNSVRVGPKCVEDELMPAILYHLAMRSLLEDFAGPANIPTGNVTRRDTGDGQMAAAHFCGSRWFRDDSGVALDIDLWEKDWPGEAFAPSCLVLPSRTAQFLPKTTITSSNAVPRVVAQPWDRVPVVFSSPELKLAFRKGAVEATAALRSALAATLPDL